jgi:hypothetical protein
MFFIKFKAPTGAEIRKTTFKKMVGFLAALVVPKANPDFEKKLDNVVYWLLEFESKNATPKREIGLDEFGSVLLKMPYGDNYGYWVDNNLTYNDFHQEFEIADIARDEFDRKWGEDIK